MSNKLGLQNKIILLLFISNFTDYDVTMKDTYSNTKDRLLV